MVAASLIVRKNAEGKAQLSEGSRQTMKEVNKPLIGGSSTSFTPIQNTTTIYRFDAKRAQGTHNKKLVVAYIVMRDGKWDINANKGDY